MGKESEPGWIVFSLPHNTYSFCESFIEDRPVATSRQYFIDTGATADE